MITVTNLWKAFGPRDLFTGAALHVGPRDRVALVGPNGSGKTTLFDMLAGEQAPDRGEIQVIKRAVIGYLRQEADPLPGRSLLDEVLTAAGDVTETGRRLAVLEEELAGSEEGPERDRLIAEHAELHERFTGLDGYSVEFEARSILAGVGFAGADLAMPADALSGGQLMRAALAKLLLAAPDLLLLDEPTNHLDIEAVEWLERFIRTYHGAVFLVSHDREFINQVATRVVEIDGGKLVAYKGDYEAYVAQRALATEQAEAAERARARSDAEAQEFIDRFRAKATKARQVQSRIKAQERARAEGGPRVPEVRPRAMGLAFPTPPRAGRVVVELHGVSFGYGATPLYAGLDLAVERGQKIALVGPNGAGKTTMLKLLAGVLVPQEGQRTLGHNVALAYFAQHQDETLTMTNRVLDEIAAAIPAGAAIRPGDLLGRFRFSAEDLRKPISVLSGGERTRLAIAKLLVTPLNVLVLDEPTNHLDIASRDVLEQALLAYQGALVLVTHDRHLIRSVATRVVEVRAGRVTSYAGDYDFYLSQRDAQAGAPPAGRAGKASAQTNAKPENGQAAADRRRAGAQARSALRALQQSVSRIEAQLEAESARLNELTARLADPAVYASGADVAGLVDDYEARAKRVKDLEAAWEEAAGLLEEQAAAR